MIRTLSLHVAVCCSLIVLMMGCGSVSSPVEVVEGTSLTLGLYIPFNGTMYGIQAVNYLQGRKIRATNNVEVSHSISNSSFGCFELIESSLIKVER